MGYPHNFSRALCMKRTCLSHAYSYKVLWTHAIFPHKWAQRIACLVTKSYTGNSAMPPSFFLEATAPHCLIQPMLIRIMESDKLMCSGYLDWKKTLKCQLGLFFSVSFMFLEEKSGFRKEALPVLWGNSRSWIHIVYPTQCAYDENSIAK